MSQDFVYGPRLRQQLGHPRQWYPHTRPCLNLPSFGTRLHQPPHPADKRTHSRPIAAVVPRSQRAPSPSGESTTSTHTRHSRALHHVTRSTWHCPRHTRRSRFIVKIVTQQTRSHTSLCCSHSLDSGRHDLWTHYDPDVRPAARKRGRGPTQSRPLAAVALWSPRAPSSVMESPRPAPTRVTPEHTVTSPGNITSPPARTSSALHFSSVKQKTRSHTFFFVALTALTAAGIA